MLEGVASSLIAKILGDYVEAVDTQNLRFTLSGELELTNLKLKKSALSKLDLPIAVKEGFLSKLFLSVPWRSLGSQPAIIKIEKIFLLAEPATSRQYDEADEKKRAQAEKLQKLELAELVKASRAQANKKGKDATPTNDDSFVKRMATTVINSLQIYVDRVHIRYEDTISTPGRPFSVGIVLNKLHGKSTDESWAPSLNTQAKDSPSIFKLLSIQDFGMYWNPNDPPLKYETLEQLSELMNALIPSEKTNPKHSYLLEPATFENRLIVTKSNIPKIGTPKFDSSLSVERIFFVLREEQYEDMANLFKRVKAHRLAQKYRKHARPAESPSKAPRAWFQWAAGCVLGDIRAREQRWKWEYIKQRRDDRISYVALYSKLKLKKKLEKTESESLSKLQEKLSFEDILYFRSLAEVQVKRVSPASSSSAITSAASAAASSISSWGGWASSWFRKTEPVPTAAGAATTPTASTPEKQQPHEEKYSFLGVDMTEEDLKEIYSSLRLDDTENEIGATNKPPPEWVKSLSSFSMKAGFLELRDLQDRPITTLSFHSLTGKAELRDEWKTFSADLESLQMTDPYTKDSWFPMLIEPKSVTERKLRQRERADSEYMTPPSSPEHDVDGDPTESSDSIAFPDGDDDEDVPTKNLFHFKMDVDPVEPNVDFALELGLEQLNIVYNYSFITRIVDFFQQPYKKEMAAESASTYGWNLDIASRRAQLLYLMEHKSTFSLKLDIHAPNFIVPQDPCDPRSPLMVLVLGQAQLQTVLSSKKVDQLNADVANSMNLGEEWMDDFYDTFRLNVTDVQALITRVQNYHALFTMPREKLRHKQLVRPFNLDVSLSLCKLNVEQLPNVRIQGALPSLHFYLPSTKLRNIMTIVYGIIDQIGGAPPAAAATGPPMAGPLPTLTSTATATSSTEASETPIVVVDTSSIAPQVKAVQTAMQDENFIKEIGRIAAEEHDEPVLKGAIFEAAFTIPDLVLHCVDADGSTKQPIVMLRLTGLGLNFRRMENLTTMDLFLHGLKVEDLLQQWGPSFRWLFDSAIANQSENSVFPVGEEDVLKLILIHVEVMDKNHPQYDNVDRSVDIKFNSISINFNRETIVKFLGFIKNFGPDLSKTRYQQPSQTTSSQPAQSARATSSARRSSDGSIPPLPPNFTHKPGASPTPAPSKSGRVTLRQQVSINAVQLLLNENGRSMAIVTLSDSVVDIKILDQALIVEGYIGALKIQDLETLGHRYSHVVAIRGEHMVDFKYTTGFSYEFPEINHVQHLFIQVNKIRWLVSLAFLGRLWRFLMTFVNMLSNKPDKTQQPAESSLPTKEPVELPTSWFSYHIKLLNPNLVWLESESSPNVIETDLGEVDVRNSLFKTDDENLDIMEELLVSVKALNAHSGYYDAYDVVASTANLKCRRILLTNTDILVAITTPALNTSLLHPGRYAGSKINVNIPSLKFILSPEQLVLLFNFFKDNWYYTPSESDLVTSRRLAVEQERAEELARAATALSPTSDKLMDRAVTTMSLRVNFGSISIDCREHIDLHTETPAQKICLLTLEHLAFVMNNMSDETSSIDFEVQSIVFRDNRENISIIKDRVNFIEPLVLDNHPQVRGSYLRQSNGHQEIQARLDQVRILAIPQLLLKLNDNGMPLITPLMEVLAKRSWLIEQTQTENQRRKALDMQQHQHRIGLEVKVTMPAMELVFLEDFSTKVTRALTASSSATISFSQIGMDQSYQLALVDFQILKGEWAKEDDIPVVLLNPTGISAEYGNTPDKVDIKILTDSTVKLVLSYRDFKILTAVSSQWSRVQAAETVQAQATQSDRPSNLKKRIVSNRALVPVAPALTGTSPVAAPTTPTADSGMVRTQSQAVPAAAAAPILANSIITTAEDRLSQSRTSIDEHAIIEEEEEATTPGSTPRQSIDADRNSITEKKERFSLSPSKIDVVVIDDVQGVDMPLFELKLQCGHTMMIDWSRSLMGAIMGRGSVDYYNSKMAAWEPFMEPWDFIFQIRGHCWKLISQNLLNINLTKQLINSVRAASRSWTEDFYHTTATTKSAPFARELIHHRYYIRNDTGLPMSYCIEGSHTNTTLKPTEEKPLVLTPQQVVDKQIRSSQMLQALASRTHVDRSALGIRSSAHKLQLHASVKGFPEVVIPNMDEAGKHCILLGTKKIVYEIQNRFGTKVISFTSTTLVKNSSAHPLQIAFQPPSLPESASTVKEQKKLFVLEPVKPGQTIPVPLEMVFEGALLFRPYNPGDPHYRWSNTKCECFSLSVDSRVIQCSPRAKGLLPFQYSVHVENTVSDIGTHFRDQFIITLAPPLVVENLLASKMKFRLFDKGTGALIATTVLAKGQRASVHTVQPRQETQMSVRVHGYEWSEKELVSSTKGVASSRFILKGDNNANDRSLLLHIDNVVDADSSRIISVYCMFWLVNKTGLPLMCTSRTPKIREDIDDKSGEDLAQVTTVGGGTIPVSGGGSWVGSGEMREWYYEDLLDEDPVMFFPAKQQSGRFFFKLGGSQWSKGFNLNTQNATTEIDIPDSRTNSSASSAQATNAGRLSRLFQVAISIYPAQNKFWKTRVITLSPRYLLLNKMASALFFRQKGSDYISSLLPGEKLPFHWPDATKEKKIRVRLNVPNCSWTGAIDLNQIDRYPLRLFNSQTGRIFIVRVNVSAYVDQGISIVTFEDEKLSAPLFRVDNYTSEKILLKQKEFGLPEVIPPKSKHAWSWQEPTKTYLVEAQFAGREALTFSLAKLKAYPPIRFRNERGDSIEVKVEVRSDKFTRVIAFRPIARRRTVSKKMSAPLPTTSSSSQRATRDLPRTKSSEASGASEKPKSRSRGGSPARQPSPSRNSSPVRRARTASSNSPTPVASSSSSSTSSSPKLSKKDKKRRSSTSSVPNPAASVPFPMKTESQPNLSTSPPKGSTPPAQSAATQPPTPAIGTSPSKEPSSSASPSKAKDDTSSGPLLQESRQKWKIELALDAVGVSIVNERPEELLYLSFEEFRLEYVDYGTKRSFEFDIKDCQIDNQLSTTYFPVLLYSHVKEPPEFFKLSIIQSLEHPDISYYNYISLLCREFNIQIDEELLIKLLAFIDVTIDTLMQQQPASASVIASPPGASSHQPLPTASLSESGVPQAPTQSPIASSTPEASASASSGTTGGNSSGSGGKRNMDMIGHQFQVMNLGGDDDTGHVVYNEMFHINPFKVNLSFVGHGRDEHDPNNRTSLTSALLAIPEKLIPSVENVPITLKGLLLKHSFSTNSDMKQRIVEHYKRQLTQELLKILGSFDALGSPISLVQNLGTGVKDLFYEPAKGITISPKEFGKGLGRGGTSFAKKATYALFNSTSKVIGSLGTGVAMISFDEDYQRERNESKRREKPRNALFGVGYGLKEFAEGIFKGVTGVVTQPIKGAQEDGAAGFFKGVGQGLLGVVVKPTVGALDMVQRTTEGIKNTTTADPFRARRRPPRVVERDRLLKPFDLDKARMQFMLHSINGGEYRKLRYWGHIHIEAPLKRGSQPSLQKPSPSPTTSGSSGGGGGSNTRTSGVSSSTSSKTLLISNKAVFLLYKTRVEYRVLFEDLVEIRKELQGDRTILALIYKKVDSESGSGLGTKVTECLPTQIDSIIAVLKEHWATFKSTYRRVLRATNL